MFTTGECERGYTGCRWGDVVMRCESEQLKALALYPGEKESYCWVDSSGDEYCLSRGGRWFSGSNAGVFSARMYSPRSYSSGFVGGRSAYFVKH